MSPLVKLLAVIRAEAGSLYSDYIADCSDGEDMDGEYRLHLDELQRRIEAIASDCGASELPHLPSAAASVFIRLNQTIVWSAAAYRAVTGDDWQSPTPMPTEHPPVWVRHPTWTHGLGKLIRLRIRDDPGVTRMDLRDEFADEEGIGRLGDYMAFLTKPGGNGTEYSAFSRGKGNRGYYMSEQAFKEWHRYPYYPNTVHYAEWVEAQRRDGAFPFGYEDDDD